MHVIPYATGGAGQPAVCENSREFLSTLLESLEMPHIHVYAHPPYIALVDTEQWDVLKAERSVNFCDKAGHFGQHLILEHKACSGLKMRVLNLHMPSSLSTPTRKTNALTRCGIMCTEAGPGAPERISRWLIGGDFNVSAAIGMEQLRTYLDSRDNALSQTLQQETCEAQKSDWACSQGIKLQAVQSWVGFSNQPCVSDTHDMVVVAGVVTVRVPSDASQLAGPPPLPARADTTMPPPQRHWAPKASVRSVVTVDVPGSASAFPSPPPAEQAGTAPPPPPAAHAHSTSAAPFSSEAAQLAVSPLPLAPKASEPQRQHAAAATPLMPSAAEQLANTGAAALPRSDSFTSAAALATSENVTGAVLVTSEASQHAVAGDDAEVTQGLDVSGDQVALLQITSAQPPNTGAAALPRNDSVTSEAAQPADAFNDVLSDLSLRAAADDETADNVLACLLFKDHGMRVKTDRELREGLGAIMDRRKAFVAKLAEERGVSAPRSHSEYTVQGWAEWLTNRRLNQWDMERGIKEWKEEFKECDLKKKAEVDKLVELNTRWSKKEATAIQRGALNAALAQQCGHAQLAFAFFQHPSAELDSLLEGWRSHMASEAFRRQFERSARNRDAAVQKGPARTHLQSS